MSRPSATLGGRVKQTRNLLASEGMSGIVERVRLRAAKRIEPTAAKKLPVSREDLLRAAEVAANGWGEAMRDLKNDTTRGGMLYVFAVR